MTVNFGVRTLLLLAATLLFIFAVFVDEGDDYANLLATGLGALTLSFLLGDMGWDRRYGTRRR